MYDNANSYIFKVQLSEKITSVHVKIPLFSKLCMCKNFLVSNGKVALQ